MANSDRLAEVAAMIAVRDEDFKPLKEAAVAHGDEPLWPVSRLKTLLGYGPGESLDSAVNRAKLSGQNVGLPLNEHFVAGNLFDTPGEIYVTRYAALLITMNADPAKEAVAIAQNYFALQADKQALEDEKRIRSRFDVASENRVLQGVAQDHGVESFQRFNGVGLAALYGGRNQDTVKAMKGLPTTAALLDYAGSEELAANLFRITQTAAALRRQQGKSETAATETHRRVSADVRQVIVSAGNTPPEDLPAASLKIDRLATQVKKKLNSGKK